MKAAFDKCACPAATGVSPTALLGRQRQAVRGLMKERHDKLKEDPTVGVWHRWPMVME